MKVAVNQEKDATIISGILLRLFMSFKNVQTESDLLKTLKLDRLSEISNFSEIRNDLKDYIINLHENWVTEEVNSNFEFIENKFEPKTFNNEEVSHNENSDFVLESIPFSISPNVAQLNIDNNATPEGQRFENIAFFNAGGSKWSQPGGKGNPVNITYSYTNLLDGSIKGLSVGDVKTAIEESFRVWSSVAPLNFTEVKDSRNSQIRIGQEYIDGRSGTLAYAYFPSNGDIKFDNGERWNINLFLETAVHELGHSLGLDHEDKVDSIMNSYAGPDRYNGLGTAFLLQDDIKGIRSIYGRGSGSVTPLGGNTPIPEPTPINPKRINGTMGDDVLIGNDRNNRIRGFAGNDYLEGGKGNDNLKGGRGADTFAFKSLDGSVDKILDFSLAEGDRVEVSGSGFGSASEFTYDDTTGGLFFGNEQFAVLDNKPSLTEISSGLVVT